ncbi:MFS general substrate transporter [Microthyrium microscopicum]|uniref:MFS general substrate transporter n=1 Tax=Microthyrium microscopicum TaxID=703497 RepID=A0A6A6UES9_9PEZI|nr:MFS general substrate transporter [Microthyrium microscopicum]
MEKEKPEADMAQRHLSVDALTKESSQELDSPQIPDRPDLSRVQTGPPYSIFSKKAKMFIVAAVSVTALISPFAATLFYPALNVLSKQLNVSASLVNLSVTTYMIAQAIAPAVLGGMSDTGGRRFSFLICFCIYIVANIGLALQTNYAALLVLRCVQAAGSSAAISLSMAVVSDIATSAERGTYTGYATAGILLGPAFGPTLGGILAEYLGWRSIFWFLAIFGGVLLVIFAIFFPETCRNVVGNGSIPAKGVNRSVIGHLQQKKAVAHMEPLEAVISQEPLKKKKMNIPNPLVILSILRDKESAIVLFYNGFFFTGQMVISSSLPYMLQSAYGYNELIVGLCFIPLGVGSLASALTMGHIVDWNFRRHAKRLGMSILAGKQQDLSNFPIERARLEVVTPNHVLGCFSVIIFGWTIKYRTSIAGPEVMLFFIGFGISSAFNITNALLIDLHRDKPATATAAVNFVRCLLSAGGVAAIVPLIEKIGAGWAFTFLALLYMSMIPMIFWMMKCGQRWRQEGAEKKALEAEKKRQAQAAEA